MKDTVFKLVSASWCNPCKGVKESLKNIKENNNVFCEVIDMDDHQEVVEKLGIRGVPTLLKFQEGIEVGRLTGSKTLNEIKVFMGV